MRCAAITRNGERCKLDATSGSYCWSHAPENAEARRSHARRGGKAAGSSEVASVKREIRAVIENVLSGGLPTNVAAVAFQGFNTFIRALEQDRRIKETEELESRIEALERRRGVA